MKRERRVIATTRVDRHYTRISRGAFEDTVSTSDGRYKPILIEHDWRIPPVGRWWPAEVVAEPDGEFSLVAENELFEPGDENLPCTDGREFKPIAPREKEVAISVGPEFLTVEGKPLIQELGRLTGRRPGFEARKSAEPPDVVVISVGVFILGQVAQGFVQALTADVYAQIKRAIGSLFATRARPEREQHLKLDLFFERQGVQVMLIQADTTPIGVEAALGRGITELDELLPALLADIPELRLVVTEYTPRGVRICYGLRRDGIPLRLGRAQKQA